ncbi:GntR family transcriptional regulator [Spongiactinospora sp. TRM90649]|uniref:GntR family transcriptional regulator n=1 Tax=Spongiactinospora sp. TRM90649 TaxID=3031114 RepID=UPI0023F8B901|nr:GntR family transcriptional regulator [Spongiactinospora sp. TRM90649]MDF5751941.1 GntR family transcriptional regulator [Spongiactinospora sp. TRM90649]
MDRDDERPLYLQVADQLRAKITSGELREGDRLPSVPGLASDLRISRSTASEALKVLISEGLAVARSGAGTFVRLPREPQRLIRAWYRARPYGSPFRQDMERQGRAAGWTYDSQTIQAPPEIRNRLALTEAEGDTEDVVRTHYVFTADEEPVMLSTSWEPLATTRGTAVVLPEDGMLAGRGVVERMLSIGVVIDDWVEEVGARLGTADECEQLKHASGSIMVTIQRSYYAGKQPVETADIVVPADRFALVYSGKMGRTGEE